MGNLYAESALNPRNLQQSFERKLGMTDDSYTEAVDFGTYTEFVRDSAGYGLAQWTYWSRKEKLLAHAKTTGRSIGDLEMQLEYLWIELQGYSGVLKAICEAKSVRKASDAVLTQYERPKDQSEKVKEKRASIGQKYFDLYATIEVTETETTTGGEIMAVKVGSARIDENGAAHGGKAGDQTGKEVSTQNWYKSSKGWRVFRAIDPADAEKIAKCMQAACDNKHIGYDQYQRNTLYKEAQPFGFDVSKVTKDCETDCSALVRVCCAFAGIMGLPEGFRTTNEPDNLLKTGRFVEMKGSKYTDSSAYLKRGDILCTKVQGHTVVVLSNGSKADKDDPAKDGLSKGDKGAEVTAMQNLLLKRDPSCLPKWGADGDFGTETEDAVKAFQKSVGLEQTGVYDAATAKLLQVDTMGGVLITGGSVNIRSAPGYDSKVLGTAHKGDVLVYQQQVKQAEGKDWYLVIFNGQNAWVSSKYAQLVE